MKQGETLTVNISIPGSVVQFGEFTEDLCYNEAFMHGLVMVEDPYIKVVKIVPGGAAWREKGLEVDDLILAVGQETGDFVDLVGMRVDDAVRYIRGKKGTRVTLTVKKADGTRCRQLHSPYF